MASRSSENAAIRAQEVDQEFPVHDVLERMANDTAVLTDGRSPADAHALNCPHCRSDHIVHWGTAHSFPRYRCSSCRKTFNILTNTPLAGLRNKDRWLTYVGTMLEGKSIRTSAAVCGVSATTAFRWHHRFKNCSTEQRARILGAIIGAHSSTTALSGISEEGGAASLAWSRDLLPVLLSWFL
jgi:transposase-like protein